MKLTCNKRDGRRMPIILSYSNFRGLGRNLCFTNLCPGRADKGPPITRHNPSERVHHKKRVQDGGCQDIERSNSSGRLYCKVGRKISLSSHPTSLITSADAPIHPPGENLRDPFTEIWADNSPKGILKDNEGSPGTTKVDQNPSSILFRRYSDPGHNIGGV
ncbi:hypothetical protein AYI69_g5747 [Smittium culicis]|uniref:Uncharacterized protein n=1 Tax=Smittium culicis TaxID=133412 RepID=A0A1R1Y3R7_9FUNG|nr:hypothetical protein AYI69_g5747 [Smittium culicis]